MNKDKYKCRICSESFFPTVYKTYSYVYDGVTHKRTTLCKECNRKYFGGKEK